jgi:hypothetical protein
MFSIKVMRAKLSMCLFKYTATKTYGWWIYFHMFFTSALNEGGRPVSHPWYFTSEEWTHQYVLDRRLGSPQSRSLRCVKWRNPMFLSRIERWFRGRLARRLVAIPTYLNLVCGILLRRRMLTFTLLLSQVNRCKCGHLFLLGVQMGLSRINHWMGYLASKIV